MTVLEFVPKTGEEVPSLCCVSWQAPSNIALIKYWGKREMQVPMNPSISFTLKSCYTRTTVTCERKNVSKKPFDFKLKGEKSDLNFSKKVQNFLEDVEQYYPFLSNSHLSIETENSFPHSTGIASSASGMSALSLCLTAIEARNKTLSEDQFYRKASFIARLGSGSACRSVKGKVVLWGKHPEVKESSDLYGIPLEKSSEIHPVFLNYCDAILIVDKDPKKISSTEGHSLMNKHPFMASRIDQALRNARNIIKILKNGDIKSFISIVEAEALMLHAMMMTSTPHYMLLKPNTIGIIHKIWQLREESVLKNISFTLDAGANVHLLYPKSDSEFYKEVIELELKPFCENGKIIYDEIGTGGMSLL